MWSITSSRLLLQLNLADPEPVFKKGDQVRAMAPEGAPIFEAWRPDGKNVKRATWLMHVADNKDGWLMIFPVTDKYPYGLWVHSNDVVKA